MTTIMTTAAEWLKQAAPLSTTWPKKGFCDSLLLLLITTHTCTRAFSAHKEQPVLHTLKFLWNVSVCRTPWLKEHSICAFSSQHTVKLGQKLCIIYLSSLKASNEFSTAFVAILSACILFPFLFVERQLHPVESELPTGEECRTQTTGEAKQKAWPCAGSMHWEGWMYPCFLQNSHPWRFCSVGIRAWCEQPQHPGASITGVSLS